jgi:signal peptidase I
MRGRRILSRAAGLCVLAAILLGGVITVATATGQIAYVATHGVSMEPQLQRGDLAVVRPAASYEVGDIVAYRSELLDTVVLHRIVASDGDRYTFKGDNNDWLDKDQPTETDLIGTLLVQVPQGGHILGWVSDRLPVLLAAIFVLGGGAASGTLQHRRRRHRTTTMASTTPITRARLHTWRGVTVGLGALTAACAVLGATAYTRPTTTTAPTEIDYTQAGEFSYSATAPAGPVYPSGQVNTGDPVYLRLVPALDIEFAYTFSSSSTRAAAGTIALAAEVADGTGWTHRVQLRRPTAFDGERAKVTGRLAVADLQALLARVHAATGVQGGTPTITVLPDIRVDATFAGGPASDRFHPRMQFQLDPLQLRLPASPATSDGTPADDVLRPHSEGTITQPGLAPARLELMGRSVTVTDARRVGLGALPAALATLAVGVALSRRLRGERARIELRHGHRIVPVVGEGGDTNTASVDVTNMRDLARLAEQHDSLILHQRTDRGDVYLLQTDHTVYRYTTRRHSIAQPDSA